MARTLLLFFIGSTLVASALSFCCSNTGWFQCCGRGPCNIFCCNCDGDSCQDSCGFDNTLVKTGTTLAMSAVGKRNAENSELVERAKRALGKGNGDPTASKFHFIDINGDGVIDLEETKAYTHMVELENEVAEIKSQHVRQKRSSLIIEQDFKAMDANGDGKIDEEEFDASLQK